MAIPSASPTASVTLLVTGVSSRVQLPTVGTPTMAIITNLSSSLVFLSFGDNTVVAAPGNVVLPPSGQFFLTIGTFTYVAGISLGGTAGVNITTCT